MLRRIVVIALVGWAASFLFAGSSDRVERIPDLSGIYRTGQGDVRISKNGEVYQLRWDYPDGSRWIGVGLLEGDVFAVAWDLPLGGNLGVCAYRPYEDKEGINLVGHWAAYQDPRPSADTLIFVHK